MAPTEIWQGGKLINKVTREDRNKHEGTIQGKKVRVKGTNFGCEIAEIQPNGSSIIDTNHIKFGDTVTLDGGEIVKSVRK